MIRCSTQTIGYASAGQSACTSNLSVTRDVVM